MEHVEFPNSERTASGLEIPKHGRNGFIPAFNVLYEKLEREGRKTKLRLVEIGSQRDWEMGNGCSTNLLAWFCRHYGGILFTVDIDSVFVHEMLAEKGYLQESAYAVQMDGIDFAKNRVLWGDVKKTDFLYLDAWDYGPSEEEKRISRNEHLRCFMFAEEHLADDALVLIDDVLDHETYEGKGKWLIPYLLDNNYELIHKDYQYLFQRRKNG